MADYALRPGAMMVDKLLEAVKEAGLSNNGVTIEYDEGYT
jgi:hypothetical protein